MNDRSEARPFLSKQALDQLFRDARSHDVFGPQPVGDELLRAIYELAKCGPTTANSQPQRILFLRSEQAKARLQPALSSSNVKKSMSAPVVAVLAYDLRFFEHLPRMFHDPRARSWYETTPDHIFTTALRNATLQGAYLMLAARALGLDCGPMSGFNNAKVDAEFFPMGNGSRISCAASAVAIGRICRRAAIVSSSMRYAEFYDLPGIPSLGFLLINEARPAYDFVLL